jgi:AraC family transcriptional regulator
MSMNTNLLGHGTYLGTPVASVKVSGVELTTTRYASSARLASHSHASESYCYLLRGRFIDFVGRHRVMCNPGALLHWPTEHVHKQHFEATGGQCFNVALEDNWLEGLNLRLLSLRPSWTHSAGHQATLVLKLYDELQRDDSLSPLAIESLAVQLVILTRRGNPSSPLSQRNREPSWLRDVVELLESRLVKPPTLSELGHTFGVDPTHVARSMRRFRGTSVTEFVRIRRLDLARLSLIHSDSSISWIAQELGFHDHSHFTRTFQKALGMSPSSYRIAHRQ